MSYYYPQVAVKLRILLEDFKLVSDASIQQPYEINVIPRSISIHKNDYKTTDTFSMELDFKNFPFDPRTIRYCGVVVYMQDMETLYDEHGVLKKIEPGAPTKIDPNQSNAVFSGFVDEDHITLDESKRTVKFDGRDFTALLIDQKYQTNSPISLNQPIDVILTTMLATFKATKQLTVINKTGGKLPTLSQYYPDFGSPLAGQRNVGKHESYWEIIQEIVGRAGLICYMDLDNLILTTPRNQAVNDDDIKFIYGKNVKNLSMKRKLGRFKGFNLQVRSRVGKKILSAKIPEEATLKWGKGFGFEPIGAGVIVAGLEPGEIANFNPVVVPVMKPDGSLDATNKQPGPYITFPVPNVANKDALIRIGQTLYEQYSLQQLEGEFETFEMLGKGQSKNSNIPFKAYDLTKMAKGQTLCIEIDTDDLSEISRLSDEAERIDYLMKRNYSQQVASVFAKTMGKFSPRFFTKSHSVTMNQDTGFSLKVMFINVVDLTQRGLT